MGKSGDYLVTWRGSGRDLSLYGVSTTAANKQQFLLSHPNISNGGLTCHFHMLISMENGKNC